MRILKKAIIKEALIGDRNTKTDPVASGAHVKGIRSDDMSLTFVRDTKPMELLRELAKRDRTVRQTSDGIYYIEELWFAVQIIVTSQLNATDYLYRKDFIQ